MKSINDSSSQRLNNSNTNNSNVYLHHLANHVRVIICFSGFPYSDSIPIAFRGTFQATDTDNWMFTSCLVFSICWQRSLYIFGMWFEAFSVSHCQPTRVISWLGRWVLGWEVKPYVFIFFQLCQLVGNCISTGARIRRTSRRRSSPGWPGGSQGRGGSPGVGDGFLDRWWSPSFGRFSGRSVEKRWTYCWRSKSWLLLVLFSCSCK